MRKEPHILQQFGEPGILFCSPSEGVGNSLDHQPKQPDNEDRRTRNCDYWGGIRKIAIKRFLADYPRENASPQGPTNNA